MNRIAQATYWAKATLIFLPGFLLGIVLLATNKHNLVAAAALGILTAASRHFAAWRAGQGLRQG